MDSLCSQTRILKGQIVNESFEPIENAIIRLTNSGKTIEADDFGIFETNIDNQEKEIEVICIGYKTEKISIYKKCYITIVMINYNNQEFENAKMESDYYKKSKRKVQQSYKKAIRTGLLRKDESCIL